MTRRAAIAAGVAVWIGVGAYQVATIGTTPFFGDESQWIAKSQGWFLLTKGEFDDTYWAYEALDQPMFIPYAFGITAAASGYNETTLNKMYDFEKDYAANIKDGRVPDERLLRRCRMVSTLLGILGCGAAMLIVWRLTGPTGGLAAGLLLGLNPLYVRSIHRAMAEGSLSLWLLAGWLLCAAYATALADGRFRRALGLAMVVGVAGGLGAMTKLNGGVILTATLGVGMVHVLWILLKQDPNEQVGPALRALATMPPAALAGYLVFIAQSPATWREPVNGPWGMAVWRSTLVAQQQQHYPESAIHGLGNRLGTTAAHLWHDYGSLAALGGWAQSVWLDAWLFGAGLLWLVVAALRGSGNGGRDSPWPDARTACVWTAVMVVPLGLSVPLDWDRYFLPAVIAGTLVQATAIGVACQHVRRRLAPYAGMIRRR